MGWLEQSLQEIAKKACNGFCGLSSKAMVQRELEHMAIICQLVFKGGNSALDEVTPH